MFVIQKGGSVGGVGVERERVEGEGGSRSALKIYFEQSHYGIIIYNRPMYHWTLALARLFNAGIGIKPHVEGFV